MYIYAYIQSMFVCIYTYISIYIYIDRKNMRCVQIYSTKIQCKDIYIDACETYEQRRGENETMETGDHI